jgi:hypothetical protein
VIGLISRIQLIEHSGGHGTSGANGGRGGDVHITVGQDQLDVLLAADASI